MAGGAKKKVWVTGAGGLVGSEIVRQATEGWDALGLTRPELDLTDFEAVRARFKKDRPSGIIHCAAMSKSPACEADPALARRTNVEVTKVLAELASEIPFVLFSSDLVFDGERGGYREADPVNPLSVYAETKVEAEAAAREHPEHLVLRISLTGGVSRTRDRGFNEEMENGWRAGRALNLFVDEFRCPQPVWVPARAVWELLGAGARGTFHLSGAEKLSRYEIGELLAEHRPELKPQIRRGTRAEYSGPPRPRDTSLNCEKISHWLSFSIPKFSEWLREQPPGSF